MTVPLLEIKLRVPRVRSGLVPRPRLTERLSAGLDCRLTLISAAAGFGKTTLLSEWAASHERPVAWLSLDEDDNDPVRFWAYFIAALQTVEAGIGEAARAMLQSAQPPPSATILTSLINEIGESPAVLILDDYHLIEATPVHESLAFLLDHMPPQMHLVIATRSDPPLPLARLRGRGQLAELRQADMRFTVAEVARLVNEVMGLDLTPEDIAAVASHTEGWIAGLQMAVVSIQGRGDVAGFVRALTGSNRYILDFLVEEVLHRQRDSVQSFLLQTAILDRFTGPLCDAVLELGGSAAETGARPPSADSDLPSPSQQILEQLEAANLFIVPLDDERRWYRYHHLFGDLLRRRLRQVQPQAVRGLHRRASRWYEQNGLRAEAIEHALCADDFERAARLVERVAEATLMRGESATFRNWSQALPEDAVRARPLLGAYDAWALLLSGRPLEEVEARLQAGPRAEAAALCAGEMASLRALVATLKGDIPRGLELSERALELLPEGSALFRSLATRNLGTLYLVKGDVAAAGRLFEENTRIARKAGDLVGIVTALQRLAATRVIQGRLREARALLDEALEGAVDAKGRLLHAAVKVPAGMADVLRECNDLAAAARHALAGIESTSGWMEVYGLGNYLVLARIRQAQGDYQAAREAIETALQLAREFDGTDLDDFIVLSYEARLCLAQGDLEGALRWVGERGLDTPADWSELETEDACDSTYYHVREIEQTTLARVYLAQGRPDEALAVLGPLLQAAETLGRIGSVIEILALQALALQAQGNTSQAVAPLERALSLAEAEGHVRVFVDEGEPMARLLYEAAVRGSRPEYVGRLLAAFPASESASAAATRLPRDVVEPLSTRELEVLQLIAGGLSNREIARRLFIAPSTVKVHTRNIYGKLGVGSRTQAVARAGILGILPPG